MSLGTTGGSPFLASRRTSPISTVARRRWTCRTTLLAGPDFRISHGVGPQLRQRLGLCAARDGRFGELPDPAAARGRVPQRRRRRLSAAM